LGRPDAPKICRLSGSKKAIGPNVILMVDFNQGLSVAKRSSARPHDR